MIIATTIAIAAAGTTSCSTSAVGVPNNGQGIVPIVTTSPGAITAITVDVEITHEWVGDLRIELTHVASDTTVVLLDRPGLPNGGFPGPFGCGGDNINATFNDASSNIAENICSIALEPVIAGTVRPNGSLSTFEGLDGDTPWLLIVSDVAAYDSGVVNSACITIDVAAVPCPADVNGSGAVDFDDLLGVLAAWGPCSPCDQDIDGNGDVNFDDLLALLAAWGPCA